MATSFFNFLLILPRLPHWNALINIVMTIDESPFLAQIVTVHKCQYNQLKPHWAIAGPSQSYKLNLIFNYTLGFVMDKSLTSDALQFNMSHEEPIDHSLVGRCWHFRRKLLTFTVIKFRLVLKYFLLIVFQPLFTCSLLCFIMRLIVSGLLGIV